MTAIALLLFAAAVALPILSLVGYMELTRPKPVSYKVEWPIGYEE